MQLITKEIEKRFNEIGRQENSKDPIVIVKYFNPTGAGTWWATEIEEYRLVKRNKNGKEQLKQVFDYNTKEKAIKDGYKLDDIIFFGYVSIFGNYNDEWGSFSLKELKGYKGLGGLGIERDLYCSEKPISQFNIPSLRK